MAGGGGGQEVARFFATLGVDNSGFTAGMSSAISMMGRGALAGVGLGTGMMAATTAFRAVEAATIGSMLAVMDYETAFTGVRKTVDASDEEFSRLDANLRNLATTTMPKTRVELAGIAQVAGQLGIRGTQNITQFTDTIAQLSTATNLTSDQAAIQMARLANIIEMPISKVGNLGSALVGLGNNFPTFESEILEFAQRMAGAAHIVGFTESQILSLSTALPSLGIQAELGGTAVQQALLTMQQAAQEGGAALDLLAGVSGMSAAQFQKQWKEDAYGAFTAFVQGLGQNEQQAGQILDALGLGGARSARVFLGLAQNTDLLSRALQMAGREMENPTALAKEFGRFSETTANRVQVFKNNVTELADVIGGPLVGALNAALGPLTKLVGMLAGLDPGGLKAISSSTGYPISADEYAKVSGAAKNLGMDPLELAKTLTGRATGIGPGASSTAQRGVMVRGQFVPLDQLDGIGNYDVQRPAAGSAGAGGGTPGLDALLKNAGGGGGKSDPLTEAWRSVTDKMTAEVADAYVKGGDAQAAIVRAKQAEVTAAITASADYMHQRWGVEMPAAVSAAADAVFARQQALTQALAQVDQTFADAKIAAYFDNGRKVDAIENAWLAAQRATTQTIADDLVRTFAMEAGPALTTAMQHVREAARVFEQAVQSTTDNVRRNALSLAQSMGFSAPGQSAAGAANILTLANMAEAAAARDASIRAANEYGRTTGDWGGAASRLQKVDVTVTVAGDLQVAGEG
ncbi:MAG: phage tail tape measure protein [Dehalococcoidia bacterium]